MHHSINEAHIQNDIKNYSANCYFVFESHKWSTNFLYPNILNALQVMSVITMTCACTVGTASLSLFVLPGVWRLRVMMFTSVFTILTTLILIGLHLTSVVHSLTLRWDRVVSYTFFYIHWCSALWRWERTIFSYYHNNQLLQKY